MKSIILWLVLLAPGCAPVATFDPAAGARPPRESSRPVLELAPDDSVGRGLVLLGEVQVGRGFGWSPASCSYGMSMLGLAEKASEIGADLFTLTEALPPSGWNRCWKLRANAYAFAAPWMQFETTSRGPASRDSSGTAPDSLLPGVWSFTDNVPGRDAATEPDPSPDPAHYRLRMVPSRIYPPFTLVAVVQDANVPLWHPGYVKALLRETDDPRVFACRWYNSLFVPFDFELILTSDPGKEALDAEACLEKLDSQLRLVTRPFIPLSAGNRWCYRLLSVDDESLEYTSEPLCVSIGPTKELQGQSLVTLSGLDLLLRRSLDGITLLEPGGRTLLLKYPATPGQSYLSRGGAEAATVQVQEDSVNVPAGVFSSLTYRLESDGFSISVAPGTGVVRCLGPEFLLELESYEPAAPEPGN